MIDPDPHDTRPARTEIPLRVQSVSVVAAGFGQNIILTTVTTFMLVYLLQYAHISTAGIAVVTIIITVAKILDAILDPIVGSLIDMTHTRWGKLRPYILFSAPAVAVFTALLFSVPDINETGQLVYFGVFYLLWGIAYTACDVPFWGLIGSAFADPVARTRVISNVRAFGAISLGLATLGMPWFAQLLSFAPETTASGWSLAVTIAAFAGMAVFLLAFFNTRERVTTAQSERLTFRQLFGTLFRNTPLLMVLLGSILGFGRYIVQAGGAVFVVIAYDDVDLFTFVGAAIIAGMVIASFLTPLVLRRVSGRALIIGSSLIGAVLYVAMYLVGFENIVAIIVFIFLTGLTLGVFLVVQTTMIADAVDDVERRTGVRNDGISFATLTFVSKIMTALAVLVFGVFVVLAGYQADVEVTPEMQNTIFISITLVPAVSCLLSAIPFWFYRLGSALALPAMTSSHGDMGKVIFDISVSVDGYVNATGETPENPMGDGGLQLHEWFFEPDEVSAEVIARGSSAIGALVGGPHDVRHVDLVVGGRRPHRRSAAAALRADARRAGGGRPREASTPSSPMVRMPALALAREAAGEGDVAIMGGAETIREFLEVGIGRRALAPHRAGARSAPARASSRDSRPAISTSRSSKSSPRRRSPTCATASSSEPHQRLISTSTTQVSMTATMTARIAPSPIAIAAPAPSISTRTPAIVKSRAGMTAMPERSNAEDSDHWPRARTTRTIESRASHNAARPKMIVSTPNHATG